MAEFVNLDSADGALSIIPSNPIGIENVNPDSNIIQVQFTPIDITTKQEVSPDIIEVQATPIEDNLPKDENVYVITIELSKSEEPVVEKISIAPECNVSRYYGNSTEGGAFKVENLFSELTDDYQRAVARRNLRIADQFSLVWGNMTGNLLHQRDLYDFIINSNIANMTDLINEINLKLAQWAYDIRVSLEAKSNILSPNFLGEPTVPTPNISDSSKKIASTEWVNARISEIQNFEISSFTINKQWMFYGDAQVDVICSWNFNNEIESQSINGILLPTNHRSYTFVGVNSPLTITLTYVISGKTYNRTLLFQKYYPTFFGTVLDYTQLEKTKENSFVINTNNDKYAYVYIPLGIKSRLAVDNIIGGFTNVGTISLFGITYYIYKTVNSGLGDLYINIL